MCHRAACLLLVAVASAATATDDAAAVPCNSTSMCEERLWTGSRCSNGYCTNPFQSGCLRSILDSDKYSASDDESNEAANTGNDAITSQVESLRRRVLSTPRTCNSEDPPDAAQRGICADGSGYPEIRLWTNNWESAFVTTWIGQIIYSEVLGVPATVETGTRDANVNFYDERSRMGYGKSNEYEMFQHAYEAEDGDCTAYAPQNRDVQAEYVPCAHMVLEAWFPNDAYEEKVKTGVSESMQFIGAIGQQNWFITRFTLEKEPSLAAYYGMQGESNRKKLADIFKRPVTFKDYCRTISPSNCTVPDDTTIQPPAEEAEEGRYFVPGVYTGHFRATAKNDCSNNDQCTGHFADYPCGWTSYFRQQRHHLNIALESHDEGEYTYSELKDIWKAASTTKSDLIGLHWLPEMAHSNLIGTEAEMVQVILPSVTSKCAEKRVDTLKRCEEDATEYDLYGDVEGSCGQPPEGIKKVAVGNLRSTITDQKDPRAKMSPAYEVYRNFVMTELQLSEIMSAGLHQSGPDQLNFGLRLATCKWMADNMEHVLKIIPRSYPQVFVKSSSMAPDAIAALVFSSASILLVIATFGWAMWKQQQRAAERIKQVEFALLLLTGLFMVSIGSLLMALEPSSGTCITSVWMITVGYTLEFVPLIVKVSAIIKVVQAASRMRRSIVNKQVLLTKSLSVSAIAAMYCALWTALDPPRAQEDLTLSREVNGSGETVVSISQYCESEDSFWLFVAFGWQGLLLLGATVLAYQMRSAPNQVNDSARLAIMIYSSFIFLLLRILTWALASTLSQGTLTNSSLQKARSLLCSLDTMANIVIYFPKLMMNKRDERQSVSSISVIASRLMRQLSLPEENVEELRIVEEETGEESEEARIEDLQREVEALKIQNEELNNFLMERSAIERAPTPLSSSNS